LEFVTRNAMRLASESPLKDQKEIGRKKNEVHPSLAARWCAR